MRKILFILLTVVILLKFPKMSGDRQYKVTVPEMDGGVDYSVGISQVRDNQLTDVKNMYWKDGALKTRPSIVANSDNIQEVFPAGHFPGTDDSYYYRSTRYFRAPRFHPTKGYGEWIADIYVEQTDPREESPWDGVHPVGSSGITARIMYANGRIEDVSPHNPEYPMDYIFGYPGMFIPASIDGGGTSYYIGAAGTVLSPKENWWVYETPYIPLVMINGTPSTSSTAGTVSGDQSEGYNLLTSAFKCNFTPDGTGHYYYLPKKRVKGDVLIKYLRPDGSTVELDIGTFSDESSVSSGIKAVINRTSGVVHFRNASNAVQTFPADGAKNTLEITAYVDPTNWEDVPQTPPSLIGRMQFCTWFGGDRSSLHGGNRLFVSGHPDHPNLVHWSAADNPLYFPENNFANIGDNTQKVTAFGKQHDMLVIFKEHEVYYSTYAASSFTEEDVVEGRVVDVASSAATFPITQLHSMIGCDSPKTIRLCANRLVWANSDKKVYTLTGANHLSEKNIFELSAPIESGLKKEDRFYDACAADWQGHYILFLRNKAYALRYDSNSFAYITSYADTERAEKALSWHIWEFPEDVLIDYAISDGENCSLVSEISIHHPETWAHRSYRASFSLSLMGEDVALVGNEPIELAAPDFSGSYIMSTNHGLSVGEQVFFSGNLPSPLTIPIWQSETKTFFVVEVPTPDAIRISEKPGGIPISISGEFSGGRLFRQPLFHISQSPIESMMQTKIFDFDTPETRKNIVAMYAGIGSREHGEVSVTYLSDYGEYEDMMISLPALEGNPRSPMYIRSRRFTPRVSRTSRFGFRLKSKGRIEIDSLVLKYQLLGGFVR